MIQNNQFKIKIFFLLFFSVGIQNSSAEQPDFCKNQAELQGTPGHTIIKACVESEQLEPWQVELQKNFGEFQMAWPTFKLIANAAKSNFIRDNPPCWTSKWIDYAGYITKVSMLMRLSNMIINFSNLDKILDDMEKKTIGNVSESEKRNQVFKKDFEEAKDITQADFYELLLAEYNEAKRFATLDVAGDSLDLANSAIESPLAIWEASFYPEGCAAAVPLSP